MPDTLTREASADSAQLRVAGLDHLVLRVSDMDRAIKFYGEVLGCQVERRLAEIGLVQLRAGDSMIDLVPRGSEPALAAGRNLDHYALRVAVFDYDALKAHLAHFGVEAGEVRRRYGAEGYGPSIYITDPDGNTVELKGPPEPGSRIAG
jgi:glyoxylase I family protein